MKNLLFLSFILLTFVTSCTKEKIVEVEPQGIENTAWTKLDHVSNGKPVYKVIVFSDTLITISYKIEKKQMYTDIGAFEYLFDNNKVWVKNPDYSMSWGEIINNEFHFGGEVLLKEP